MAKEMRPPVRFSYSRGLDPLKRYLQACRGRIVRLSSVDPAGRRTTYLCDPGSIKAEPGLLPCLVLRHRSG